MAKYTIKMNVVVMGLETIVVNTPQEFEVGKSVTITPTQTMKVQDQNGNSVTIPPSVTMSGTVVAKE